MATALRAVSARVDEHAISLSRRRVEQREAATITVDDVLACRERDVAARSEAARFETFANIFSSNKVGTGGRRSESAASWRWDTAERVSKHRPPLGLYGTSADYHHPAVMNRAVNCWTSSRNRSSSLARTCSPIAGGTPP